MTMYRAWNDFVIYPHDPRLVTNEAMRLDTSDPRGMIVDRTLVEPFKGVFEAMDITPAGDVTIWTSDAVWTLVHTDQLEKLAYVERRPALPPKETGWLGGWRDFVITDGARVRSASERMSAAGLPLWQRGAALAPRSVVTEQALIGPDESLDAVAIGQYGSVDVWTSKRLWFVSRVVGKEVFVCLPRDPSSA